MNILTIYRSGQEGHEWIVAAVPCDRGVSPFVPSGSAVLMKIAAAATLTASGSALPPHERRPLFAALIDETETSSVMERIRKALRSMGVRDIPAAAKAQGYLLCSCPLRTLKSTVSVTLAVNRSESDSAAGRQHKAVHKRKARTGGPADALDWKEAQELISSLKADGRYRDALLIACGCYLGLRISDILNLTWEDILNTDRITLREKKTGKNRSLKINPALQSLTSEIRDELGVGDESSYVFSSWMQEDGRPISRQRAAQILKEISGRYHVKTARRFSTHSLRKTFGRRVWEQECGRGRGEQALYLLGDVFGHSSIAITKRYLGIRQEEILSVYDNL